MYWNAILVPWKPCGLQGWRKMWLQNWQNLTVVIWCKKVMKDKYGSKIHVNTLCSQYCMVLVCTVFICTLSSSLLHVVTLFVSSTLFMQLICTVMWFIIIQVEICLTRLYAANDVKLSNIIQKCTYYCIQVFNINFVITNFVCIHSSMALMERIERMGGGTQSFLILILNNIVCHFSMLVVPACNHDFSLCFCLTLVLDLCACSSSPESRTFIPLQLTPYRCSMDVVKCHTCPLKTFWVTRLNENEIAKLAKSDSGRYDVTSLLRTSMVVKYISTHLVHSTVCFCFLLFSFALCLVVLLIFPDNCNWNRTCMITIYVCILTASNSSL